MIEYRQDVLHLSSGTTKPELLVVQGEKLVVNGSDKIKRTGESSESPDERLFEEWVCLSVRQKLSASVDWT